MNCMYDPILNRQRSGKAVVSTVIADPPAEFTVLDPVFGRCSSLSPETPLLSLASPVWGIRKVRMRIVSAKTGVTGKIVLVPIVAGVEQTSVTLPVGAEPAAVEFPLDATGSLAFRRASESMYDTLKDDSAVAAIVLNLELLK